MKKLIVFFTVIFVLLNTGFAALYFFVVNAPASTEVTSDEAVAEELSRSGQTDDSSAAASSSTEDTAEATESLDEPVINESYYRVHFNYGDAVDLCIQEARSRNANIIQLAVNEHSTRFDDKEGFYLVKLDSYVGTPMLYDEKTHTCEVDPNVQGVAFYKEIIRRTAVRPYEP